MIPGYRVPSASQSGWSQGDTSSSAVSSPKWKEVVPGGVQDDGRVVADTVEDIGRRPVTWPGMGTMPAAAKTGRDGTFETSGQTHSTRWPRKDWLVYDEADAMPMAVNAGSETWPRPLSGHPPPGGLVVSAAR